MSVKPWSTKQFLWGYGGWGILLALGLASMGCSAIDVIPVPVANSFGAMFLGAAAMQALARSEASRRGWHDEEPKP